MRSVQSKALARIEDIASSFMCEVVQQQDFGNAGLLLVQPEGEMTTLLLIAYDFQARIARFKVAGVDKLVSYAEADSWEALHSLIDSKLSDALNGRFVINGELV